MTEPLTPLDHWLAAARRPSLMILGALAPLPIVAGEGAGSLVMAAMMAGIVMVLSRSESGDDRRRFLQVAALSAAVRGVLLLLVTLLQTAGDALVLGPDGARFLASALMIIDAGFALPDRFAVLGTFDIGHMYAFAAVIALFGQSIFNLHAFNCALTVLIAPLTFGWVRRVAPRAALPAAVLVSVYPSIVYLAAVDIWKDPSVITATTLGIWALACIAHDTPTPGRLAALVATGAAAFSYVHVSRFYPLWYIEVGLAGAALVTLLRRGSIQWTPTLATTAVVLLAELGPMAGGWPPSPRMFAAGVVQATNADSLRRYTAGLLERMAEGADAPADRGTAFRVEQLDRARLGEFSKHQALQVDIETGRAEPSRFGVFGWATQFARRVWGPFVWISPPTLSPRVLLGGDYLLYPGMVFWYALLPFMAAGLVLTAVAIVRGQCAFILATVWTFAVGYSAQFVVINLPYRQREAMFPVLVVFACLGAMHLWRHRWARVGYVLYWVALALVAAAHTAIRARFV